MSHKDEKPMTPKELEDALQISAFRWGGFVGIVFGILISWVYVVFTK